MNVPAPLSSIGSQVLGVGLSPILGANLSTAVGIPNQSSFNFEELPSTLASEIPDYDLGNFNEVLDPYVDQAIEAVSGIFGSAGVGGPGPAGNSQLAYPGAGEEPEAEYGGSVYNTSTPVVFSLNRAEAAAKSEGMASLFGGGDSLVPPLTDIPDYSSAFAGNTPNVNVTSAYGTTGSFAAQGAAKLGAQDYSSSLK